VNIDVDLDALDLSRATLSDVLALINTAGGGAVTASLAAQGNGIVITDNTTGGSTLRITRQNLSPAIDGLGLNVEAQGDRLVGRDVNPIITDSAFTGLRELRLALDADDSGGISRAAVRLKRVLDDMQEVQGRLAGKARGVLDRELRVDGELASTQVLLSDVRDVDFTEAIVSFQKFQLALQANLATGSRAFDLSLIDFLR
jgi:flagellin-like hook-associated protein FlgL